MKQCASKNETYVNYSVIHLSHYQVNHCDKHCQKASEKQTPSKAKHPFGIGTVVVRAIERNS